MNHYVITTNVFVNGQLIRQEILGSVTSTSDYKPNRIKETVKRHYVQKFPGAKVACVIHEVKPVSKDEYENLQVGFSAIPL